MLKSDRVKSMKNLTDWSLFYCKTNYNNCTNAKLLLAWITCELKTKIWKDFKDPNGFLIISKTIWGFSYENFNRKWNELLCFSCTFLFWILRNLWHETYRSIDVYDSQILMKINPFYNLPPPHLNDGVNLNRVINGQFHRTSSRRPSWSPTTLQIGSKFMKFEAATPSLKPVQTNSFSFNKWTRTCRRTPSWWPTTWLVSWS